ncbi:MAG: hypothetical protein RR575_00895 [Acinetobacter sp.]
MLDQEPSTKQVWIFFLGFLVWCGIYVIYLYQPIQQWMVSGVDHYSAKIIVIHLILMVGLPFGVLIVLEKLKAASTPVKRTRRVSHRKKQ